MFCAGCGAPLALGPEPAARPLDVSLTLDRRGDAREPGTPSPLRGTPPPARPATAADTFGLGPPPPAAPPPAPSIADTFAFGRLPPPPRAGRAREVDRSGWDLGPPLGVRQGDASPPAAPAAGPASQDEDFEFGPLPDLRAEPEAAPRRPAGPLRPAAVLAAVERPDPAAGAPLDAGPLEPLLDGPERPLDEPVDVDVDAVEVHLRRPPTWRRAASWAVDAIPFAALAAWGLQAIAAAVPAAPGAPQGLAHAVDVALRDGGAIALPLAAGTLILALVYQVLGHALAGATLGKWLLGLRVVGPDGRRPSLARSAARAALSAASVLLLGLGVLLALFTRSGRALHDLAAGTWVVEAP